MPAPNQPVDQPGVAPVRVNLIGDAHDGSDGLMLLAVCGPDQHALLIDPLAAAAERLPLELHGHALVLMPARSDRLTRATLANRRRDECQQAAYRMGAESLRDALLQDLHLLPDQLACRARHVITENGRVLQAADALRLGDIERLGRLLLASQVSVRDDFQACDAAAQAAVHALERAGALGARMLSAELGGGVVGLMAPAVAAPAGAAVLIAAE